MPRCSSQGRVRVDAKASDVTLSRLYRSGRSGLSRGAYPPRDASERSLHVPFLWNRSEQGDWAATPLTDRPVDIESLVPSAIQTDSEKNHRVGGPAGPQGGVRVFPTGEGLSRCYVLLGGVGEAVRVNGLPLATGIRVLADGDEIVLSGRGRVFFSAEILVRVDTYPGGERPIECVRCTLPIDAGSQVVRCPVCLVTYHQDADLTCWTCAPTCRLCGRETSLDEGFRWTPEGVWA